MRVYATRWFERFARRERIESTVLIEAVERIMSGQVDADLGGEVFKQRIARPGAGRSGGYRSIIVVRKGTRAIFVDGFAKSRRDNIGRSDLERYRLYADEVLGYDEKQIEHAIEGGVLKEVRDGTDLP